jgi:PAS domain S-box-containing protein
MILFSDIVSGQYFLNPWALPNFFSAGMLLYVCLSEFVAEWGSLFSRYQLAFGGLLSFYFVTFGMAYCSVDGQTAQAWTRLAYLGIPFIPVPLFFWLPYILGNPAPRLVWRTLIVGCAFLFMVLGVFSPLLVAGAQHMRWGYTKLSGPLSGAFTVYFAAIIGSIIHQAVQKKRKSVPGTKTSQGLTVLLWASVLLCFSGIDFLPGFSVNIYPAGNVFSLVFVGMLMVYRVRYGKSIFNLYMAADDILSATVEAIVVVDSKGTVVYANPAANELFDSPVGKLEGRMVGELLPGMPAIRQLVQSQCTQRPGNDEFFLTKRNGESCWINMSCSFSDKTSGIGRWAILSFQDISKRKEVEIRLEQFNAQLERTVHERTQELFTINEKLVEEIEYRKKIQAQWVQTEKMASVGRLAAGIAHEINNPLSGILQSVQVVNRRLDPGEAFNLRIADRYGIVFDSMRKYLDDREIISMLNNIRVSAQRAAKIVSEMLEFSHTGRSCKEPTDLNGLLDKAIELVSKDYDLNTKYDFRKVKIIKEYDLLLPQVPCEPSQIQQVVLNLLTNAAHALNELAAPGFSPEIHIRTIQMDGVAVIEIGDNGPGISAESNKIVFEPFYTTKQVGEGTGLGLSVAYFIVVNNHDGSLEVDSPQAGGATFTIRLPLSTTPLAA